MGFFSFITNLLQTIEQFGEEFLEFDYEDESDYDYEETTSPQQQQQQQQSQLQTTFQSYVSTFQSTLAGLKLFSKATSPLTEFTFKAMTYYSIFEISNLITFLCFLHLNPNFDQDVSMIIFDSIRISFFFRLLLLSISVVKALVLTLVSIVAVVTNKYTAVFPTIFGFIRSLTLGLMQKSSLLINSITFNNNKTFSNIAKSCNSVQSFLFGSKKIGNKFSECERDTNHRTCSDKHSQPQQHLFKHILQKSTQRSIFLLTVSSNVFIIVSYMSALATADQIALSDLQPFLFHALKTVTSLNYSTSFTISVTLKRFFNKLYELWEIAEDFFDQLLEYEDDEIIATRLSQSSLQPQDEPRFYHFNLKAFHFSKYDYEIVFQFSFYNSRFLSQIKQITKKIQVFIIKRSLLLIFNMFLFTEYEELLSDAYQSLILERQKCLNENILKDETFLWAQDQMEKGEFFPSLDKRPQTSDTNTFTSFNNNNESELKLGPDYYYNFADIESDYNEQYKNCIYNDNNSVNDSVDTNDAYLSYIETNFIGRDFGTEYGSYTESTKKTTISFKDETEILVFDKHDTPDSISKAVEHDGYAFLHSILTKKTQLQSIQDIQDAFNDTQPDIDRTKDFHFLHHSPEQLELMKLQQIQTYYEIYFPDSPDRYDYDIYY